jgi:NAD-dependent DNA ligase
VLADDIVTDDERRHLVDTLKLLIEDRLDELVDQVDLTELWFDEVGLIDFHDARFCLTGNFVFGPLDVCKTAIEQRGGLVSSSMGATEHYLVIGSLGLDEWRSGGLGAEIERALRLRAEGKPIKIISEGCWVTHL